MISVISISIYSLIINRSDTYEAYGVFQSDLFELEDLYTFNFKKDNKFSLEINTREKNNKKYIKGNYKYLSEKTYLLTTSEKSYLITITNKTFLYLNDQNQIIKVEKKLDVPFIE